MAKPTSASLGNGAFEVQDPVGGCCDVRFAGVETERPVERLSLDHGRECVQHKPRQPKTFRLGDEALHESSTEPSAS